MRKCICFFIVVAIIPLLAIHAQTTTILDEKFEQALIDLGIDSNETLNGEVLTDDISSVTDLNIFDKGITDLTGIEDFLSLETLNCSNNLLSTIDISNNVELIELNCSSNQLTALNVLSNQNLERLYVQDNLLTGLDLSANVALLELDVNNNQITNLDVANNDLLVVLKLSDNRLTSLLVGNNPDLVDLVCSNNQIDALDVSNNAYLRNFLAGSNQLSSINLSANDSIRILDVGHNQLSNLSVTENRFIENLTCSGNQLSSLNLTENDSLVTVGASNNQLTELDIGNNLKLQNLAIASNQITLLNVSSNVFLRSLDVFDNLLTDLDLSLMNSVVCQDPDDPNELCQSEAASINVSRNQLISLTISNGFNDLLTNFSTIENPDLKCIVVDDPDEALLAENWLKDPSAYYATSCENVIYSYVPDDNFEIYLETHDLNGMVVSVGDPTSMGDGIEGNNFVLTANIETITDLDLSDQGICDLTGIKDFTALLTLNISDNMISNCPDDLNGDPHIYILDLSANTNLTSLTCSNNNLRELDLSGNINLTELDANTNALTALDLSYNNSLAVLNVSFNQLTQLEVSSLTELTELNCSDNTIAILDLSLNTTPTTIDCSSNNLGVLNISNGFNDQITNFDAQNNPDLDCILVDDPDAANVAVNWFKDNSATYSVICDLLTFIPDDNFEQRLIDLLYDDVLDNFVVTDSISDIIDFSVSGLAIADLTGIQDFMALQTLDCSFNALTNLDLSGQTSLTELYCNNNELSVLIINDAQIGLTNFDATSNEYLYCIDVDDPNAAIMAGGWSKDDQAEYNQDCSQRLTLIPDDNFEQALIDLGYDSGPIDDYVPTSNIEGLLELDVSEKNIFDLTGIENFVALDSLKCSGNYLTALNVSNNLRLVKLKCSDNNLTNLDVSSNLNLLQLICDSNNLSEIDVSANLNLTSLIINSNHIESDGLNLSANQNLIQLVCADNNLDSLNVANNEFLLDLDFADNKLIGLDLSFNENLLRLNCSNNFLTQLEVDQNAIILDIKCDSNQIEMLDFSTNNLLYNLSADDNELTNINLLANDSLRRISVGSNKLIDLDLSNNLRLKYLKCDDNDLALNDQELNLTFNDSLEVLYISNNGLTSLDVGNNQLLKILDVSNNSLETIDLTNNIEITDLNISSNQFSELNFSAMDSLVQLNISANQFTALDLNAYGYLKRLNCSDNDLVSLKVANGNNNDLAEFNALNNPDLFCIEIDNENEIGEDWLKDEGAAYSVNCHYNDTYVPNDAFEAAIASIISDPNDTLNDDYIPTESIEGLLELDVSGQNIGDLTGIEDFTALEILDVSSNAIDSLNVSYNTALVSLTFSNNPLTSDLDLSNNPELTTLIGNNAGLSTLDLSNNMNITDLQLASNQLSEVDLSQMSDLSNLVINDNQMIDLDLSNNSVLSNLNCASNQLLTLNIQNGNNSNLATLDASNNPDLTCIEADQETIPDGVTWDIGGASLSLDCHYYETYVPDDGFETALINLGFDAGDLDDYVPTPNISTASSLNVSNRDINDLTGIEDFVSLISFNCGSNQLSEIDLSNNPAIENLNCSNNLITNIDLSTLSNLMTLDASDNALLTIDVSSNLSLYNLNVGGNDLTDLDLSASVNLTSLDCSYNALDQILDLSQNTLLAFVSANSNQLIGIDIQNGNNPGILHFDATDNPNLTCVLVDELNADFSNWSIDPWAAFKLICDDFDNDGVANNEDLCPNTPIGDPVDLFGCSYFILPADNFNVLVTDENCISSNNGSISISANELHNYIATVTGENYLHTFNFTNNGVNILNLHAGSYEVCITVDGEPDFIICYNVIITEPEPLAVSRSVNHESDTVSFELSGGLNYIINFNGLEFNTSEQEITLGLMSGINTITIRTDLECQGVYTKRIYNSNELFVYPNPFNNHINILTGDAYSGTVEIKVYSAIGQLVLEKTGLIEEGSISFEASNLTSGIYLVSFKSDTTISSFKIVKK